MINHDFIEFFQWENPESYVGYGCDMLNDLLIKIHMVSSLIWDQSQVSISIRLEMASNNAREGQSAQMQIAYFSWIWPQMFYSFEVVKVALSIMQ